MNGGKSRTACNHTAALIKVFQKQNSLWTFISRHIKSTSTIKMLFLLPKLHMLIPSFCGKLLGNATELFCAYQVTRSWCLWSKWMDIDGSRCFKDARICPERKKHKHFHQVKTALFSPANIQSVSVYLSLSSKEICTCFSHYLSAVQSIWPCRFYGQNSENRDASTSLLLQFISSKKFENDLSLSSLLPTKKILRTKKQKSLSFC